MTDRALAAPCIEHMFITSPALQRRPSYPFSFVGWGIFADAERCCAGLTGLTELNLQGCRNICNPPNQGLQGLGALSNLAVLNMRNCDGLTDGALAPLSCLVHLLSLDLSGCQHLSGAGWGAALV